MENSLIYLYDEGAEKRNCRTDRGEEEGGRMEGGRWKRRNNATEKREGTSELKGGASESYQREENNGD